MAKVNMHEAKTNLSKLVEAIESGKETEIVIARNGKPVARIVALDAERSLPRPLGLHDGEFGDLSEEWFKEWQALDAVIWEGVLDKPIEPPLQPAVVRPARRKRAVK